MHKLHINLYATRDLDGCLCAVLAHLLAADKGGGVTVEWINPGDLSGVSRLAAALEIADLYGTPLPDVRLVLVCGARITDELRSRLEACHSLDHMIELRQANPRVLRCLGFRHPPRASRAVRSLARLRRCHIQHFLLRALLAKLGPENLVLVLYNFCRNHPHEQINLLRFTTPAQFISYAGQQ